MAGVDLLTIAVGAIIALAIALAFWAAHEIDKIGGIYDRAFGDVVEPPKEMTAARKKPGGGFKAASSSGHEHSGPRTDRPKVG